MKAVEIIWSGGWEDVRDEKTCSVRKPAGLEDLRNRSNSRTRRPARWVDLQVKRVQVFSFRGSERTNADLSFGSIIFGSGCISNIVLGKFGQCCCYASHLGHQTHEQGLVITLQRESKIILRTCKSDRVNSTTEVFWRNSMSKPPGWARSVHSEKRTILSSPFWFWVMTCIGLSSVSVWTKGEVGAPWDAVLP